MPSWALGLLPGWRSQRRLLGAGGSSGVSPRKPLGSGAAAGDLLGRGSWGIPREPPYPELSHPRAGTRGCPVGGVRLFTSASNPSPELGTAAITMFNENKVIPQADFLGTLEGCGVKGRAGPQEDELRGHVSPTSSSVLGSSAAFVGCLCWGSALHLGPVGPSLARDFGKLPAMGTSGTGMCHGRQSWQITSKLFSPG